MLAAPSALSGLFAPSLSSALGLAAGVAFSAALVMLSRTSTGTISRDTALAAAESIRSIYFRYLAQVSPYDGADRETVMTTGIEVVSAGTGYLRGELGRTAPDSVPPPNFTGVAGYVAARAGAQESFFAARAARHVQSSRRLSAARSLMLAVAAACCAFTAFAPVVEAIVLALSAGTATTAAALIGAHASRRHHVERSIAYTRAAGDLHALLDAHHDGRLGDEAFVDDVERTIRTVVLPPGLPGSDEPRPLRPSTSRS
jgi:hypothetical protein